MMNQQSHIPTNSRKIVNSTEAKSVIKTVVITVSKMSRISAGKKRGMTNEFLKCRADLNSEVDLPVAT